MMTMMMMIRGTNTYGTNTYRYSFRRYFGCMPLRRSTPPPCSLPRPTWQWPSSLPGNPAEYSIGHTWLSCGTFRGSFLGLHWSQRQFPLLLWILPSPHCPFSMRTYISSSGGLRRGQRLHCWLLEEKTWVSISWKLTSIQCSFVT